MGLLGPNKPTATRPNWRPPVKAKGLLDIDYPTARKAAELATLEPGLLGSAVSAGLTIDDLRQGNFGSAALNALGILPFVPAMTAWHGSPHKFDKFSLDKIGTGEGAQAYGHGLYLAENPAVATEYQNTLRDIGYSYNGEKINRGKNPVTETAAKLLYEAKGNKAAALKAADGYAYDNLLKLEIEKLDPSKVSIGNLYKTDIPDEAVARFLDWDKPLSQQEGVLKLFRDMHELNGGQAYNFDGRTVMLDVGSSDALKGKDFYQWLNSNASGKEIAPSVLKQNGIPGIRYLDGGSRSAGQGSSNFVIFDPEMIRILERNGQATGLNPWKPGEWQGLLGP